MCNRLSPDPRPIPRVIALTVLAGLIALSVAMGPASAGRRPVAAAAGQWRSYVYVT